MPRPICQVPGCGTVINARGYCFKHYQRFMKYGDPQGGQTHAPAAIRFWRFVERGGPRDCWKWTGKTENNGYGRLQVGGKGSPQVGAHRFSYEMHYGAIPDGMVVMHSCDNPGCVNPAHLSVGTHKQNTGDMLAKGRHARMAPLGTANGKAETHAALARRLGVGVTTVRGVRSGRVWSHVT